MARPAALFDGVNGSRWPGRPAHVSRFRHSEPSAADAACEAVHLSFLYTPRRGANWRLIDMNARMTPRPLSAVTAIATVLVATTLVACNRADDTRTAGERTDSATATAERKMDQARSDASQAASEFKQDAKQAA